MIIVKHPTIPSVTRNVAVEDVPRWEAQGWHAVADAEQRRELDEHKAETAHACPTCGAAAGVPCMTPSGTPAKRTHKARLSA